MPRIPLVAWNSLFLMPRNRKFHGFLRNDMPAGGVQFETAGCSNDTPQDRTMGRNDVSPEKAARRREVLASIGRALKEQYVPAQLLSDRLCELVRKIEQSSGESESEPLHRCPELTGGSRNCRSFTDTNGAERNPNGARSGTFAIASMPRKMISLGTFPKISLVEARGERDEARKRQFASREDDAISQEHRSDPVGLLPF
jgi:hypothetical protein